MRVKLHLCKSMKSASGSDDYMRGCTTASNGQIIFAEPANKALSVYDSKGNFSSNIAVSTYPFDVTSINYYTFAVTYDKVCFIDTSKNTRSVQRYRTSYPCREILT